MHLFGVWRGSAWLAMGCAAVVVGGCSRNWDAFDRVDAGSDFCAGKHDLCETFDNGGWGAEWQNVAEKTLVVDGTEATSKPDALHVLCGSDCPNGKSELWGTVARPNGTSTLTCKAAVRLDSFIGDATSLLDAFGMSIRACPLPCDYTVQLAIGQDGTASLHNYVNNGTMATANNDLALSVPFSQGAWHEVEVQAIYGTGDTTVLITIDGALGIMQTLAPAPVATSAIVLAGVSFDHGNTASWEMHVDDVVCDWTP